MLDDIGAIINDAIQQDRQRDIDLHWTHNFCFQEADGRLWACAYCDSLSFTQGRVVGVSYCPVYRNSRGWIVTL